jgi:hypothetical protein
MYDIILTKTGQSLLTLQIIEEGRKRIVSKYLMNVKKTLKFSFYIPIEIDYVDEQFHLENLSGIVL